MNEVNSSKPENVSPPSWGEVDDYFAGTPLPPDRSRAIQEWLSVAGAEQRAWNAISRVVRTAHEIEISGVEMRAVVRKRIADLEKFDTTSDTNDVLSLKRVRRSRRVMWWVPAASIIAIVLGFWIGTFRNIPKTYQYRTTFSAAANDASHGVLYSTRRGQLGSVDLPDGTRVTLNAASTLSIPQNFGHTTREVRVDGETVFQVNPVKDLPFVVHSLHRREMRITVLGTTFSVRAYRGDPQIQVAVLQGRVAVNDAVLQPGDIARTPRHDAPTMPTTPVSIYHNQDVVSLTSWMRGQLSYTRTPLPLVIADLERTYDINIEYEKESSMVHRTITGTFSARTLDELIPALEFVLNTRVTIQGHSLVLH